MVTPTGAFSTNEVVSDGLQWCLEAAHLHTPKHAHTHTHKTAPTVLAAQQGKANSSMQPSPHHPNKMRACLIYSSDLYRGVCVCVCLYAKRLCQMLLAASHPSSGSRPQQCILANLQQIEQTPQTSVKGTGQRVINTEHETEAATEAHF